MTTIDELTSIEQDWGGKGESDKRGRENPYRPSSDGKDFSKLQIQKFIKDGLKTVARAAWFDSANTRILFFVDEATKTQYLTAPDDSLVLYSVPLEFSGVVRRVNYTNLNGTTTINAITNQTEVSLRFRFVIEEKGISDPTWTQRADNADIVVYAKTGADWVEVTSLTDAEPNTDLTFNVRDYLAVGKSQIKFEIIGRDEQRTTTTLVYSVTLADMYVENWDFENDRKSYWFRPIIEDTRATSPSEYSLGGFLIKGAVQKTLHLDIYADRDYTQEPLLELSHILNANEYTTTPFFLNGIISQFSLTSLQTGSYVAKVYLTSGQGADRISTEASLVEYPFMYIASGEQSTAQLVAVNRIEPVIYNSTTARICEFAVYDKGYLTSTPTRDVQQYNVSSMVRHDTFTSEVNCSERNTLDVAIEIDSESTQLGDLFTVTSITLGESSVTFNTNVDNSNSYPAVGGYDFYINPVLQFNADENHDKIVNAVNGTVYSDVIWGKTSFVDSFDGWTEDESGNKCLKMLARGKMTLPYTDINLFAGGRSTLDMLFKIDNATDADEPSITLATTSGSSFAGIRIYPERVLVHSSTDTTDANDTNRGTYLTPGVMHHLVINIEPTYQYDKSLVTGWVDGCENFQFEYAGNFNIFADLVVGSDTADVYLYYLRHYTTYFASAQAEANYIASRRSWDEKEKESTRIKEIIDSSHQIDFNKVVASGKYNYYVVEMLGGAKIPARANGWTRDGSASANIEMHYVGNPERSFRVRNVRTDGQGTTSMGYWLWNIRHRIDKSEGEKCAVSYWNPQTGTWGEETQSGTVKFDGTLHPEVKRITAKINFASSMQSHKMGATYAYNELHNAMYDGLMLNDAQRAAAQAGEPVPSVAVYQYPAFGFAKVGDSYSFIGLFTVGPDKGDDATFGYDYEPVRNDLITMEGPDHTPRLTMFQYPWNEKVGFGIFEESGKDVGKLHILDNGASIGEGGWEIGICGGYKTDKRGQEALVNQMLSSKFKPAYDVVYNNSTLIFPVALDDEDWGGADAAAVVANINADLPAFSVRHYNQSRFPHIDMEFWVEDDYTLYHYDPVTESYVAGANLVTQHGDPTGDTLDEQNEWFKQQRRARFMQDAPNFWNIPECIFNFVFLLMFGATDNFGKNSYPYYMSSTGKWCFRQDDLDGIYDIDNNGGDTKPYYIEFEDTDSSGSLVFGGGASVLWNLIFECYMDDYDGGSGKGIRSFGAEMLSTMRDIAGTQFNVTDGALKYIEERFWNKAQIYFPVSAYNSDDLTKYIDAWLNDNAAPVNPLAQALGNHYAAERRWVEMRVLYMASYFRVGPFGDFSDASFGQILFRPASLESLTLKMYSWLYPQIREGQGGSQGTGRVEAGGSRTFTGFTGGGQTQYIIKTSDYITEIDGLQKLMLSGQQGELTINAKRLTKLTLGDADSSEVDNNITTVILNCPSVSEIEGRNSALTGELDLRSCTRLKKALLENTQVSHVRLPNGSKIEILHLPSTVTTLVLNNTHFIEAADLSVPNWAAITDLEMYECNALNTITALTNAYTAQDSELRNVTLRWNTVDQITAPVITMLAAIAAKVSARTFSADMQGQMKLDQGHYEADFEALRFVEQSPSTMAGYKEALSTIFNHPLRLFYKDITYMPFADAEVLRVLLQHWGDGVGLTTAQVQAITSIGTYFRSNTAIVSFNEFGEFTGVTSIGVYAFSGCTNLETINLPVGITSIGDHAFTDCTKLHLPEDTLYLPNLTGLGRMNYNGGLSIKHITDLGSITAIEDHCFNGWSLLEDVVLPGTVTSIDSYAFDGCTNLLSLTVNATTPPSLGGNVFRNCSKLAHIYVPAASVETYKAASGWSTYASIISAIPTEE